MDEKAEGELSGLAVSDVWKSFETPHHRVEVLRGVSLELDTGQALSITGPSGSGKSTLLHLMGGLDQPTRGTIRLGKLVPQELDERELARFRNQHVGFVFQDHHLLPQYTVLQNVVLPTAVTPTNNGDNEARARHLLEAVGLADRLEHRPAELSGGERQRVAIARALINKPNLLLCDEPTGNLDGATATTVADLLFELHAEEENILIVVTHSPSLAARFERQARLAEGRLVPSEEGDR